MGAMMHKREPEAELPASISDEMRGQTAKVQPLLVGFVLATIIGMISIAAFLGH